MPRLEHTLGLRAHSSLGPRGPRTFLPLPRALAQSVRAAIEAQRSHGVEHPLAAVGLPEVRAVVLESGRARISYLLGGPWAALRRVVIVEGEDAGALLEELRPALGGVELLARATPATLAAHAAAFARGRRAPAVLARAWLDGEAWPPTGASAVGHIVDTSGTSEVLLPGVSRWLVSTMGRPESARGLIARGAVAQRWRTLEAHAPLGTSPLVDLKSGGASFTFTRMVGDRAQVLPAGHDYAALWAPEALRAAERWVLERDRFGAESALVDALGEAELAARLSTGGLPIDHEVLHFDRLPRAWLRAVLCRNDRAAEALGEVDVPVHIGERIPGADQLAAQP